MQIKAPNRTETILILQHLFLSNLFGRLLGNSCVYSAHAAVSWASLIKCNSIIPIKNEKQQSDRLALLTEILQARGRRQNSVQPFQSKT